MITVFGCPVNSDYLETLLKNAGYDPSDESGVVKIVATNDGKITAHWPDGTTSELVGATAGGTDEKVKTTSADSTEGYLGDKIDDDTIVVDTANQTIKVASGKFITAGSTIDWDDVDKTGSKLSDLEDVPSYQASKVLGVDSAGTTLQWVTNAGSTAGATEFTGLSDTPSTYSGSGSYYVAVKSDESGLEFVSSGGTGASTFLDLTDTPSSYTGEAAEATVVNTAESTLRFSDEIYEWNVF